ncbi:MAG TPA: FKBP-type peptidyl-prolyl cis-trans isomerase, partial [Bacteroidia bacterium]|nr:FKBP-type peptidyl-prolyl cis-trans isomerase [Bacteroidia bacterium]
PPSLGYGDQARGLIPANSTLIFDVQLVKVTEGVKPFDVKGKDTIKTPSGLKYIIVKENKAGETTTGKRVTINYSGFLIGGKCFDSSQDRGQPLTAEVGRGKLFPGLDESLSLLKKGEKAKFIIPSSLAFGERGGGPIPPNSDLIMDVEVTDVKEIPVPVKFDTAGVAPKVTATGLKYFEIKKSGSTQKAEAGKNVKVHYTGYLADGKIFDSSVERDQPIDFQLGAGMVIPGWEEGIALMNVGDKYRLVIPSQLGYGEAGRAPVIPPNAELTFDIELISISDAAQPQDNPGDPHTHSDEPHNH